MLAEALLVNHSLERLSICVDNISKSGAEAFASVLERNKTLHISDIFSFLHKTADDWVSEFLILSIALHHNTTLEKLKIIPPLLFQAEAVTRHVTAIEYAKDNRVSMSL